MLGLDRIQTKSVAACSVRLAGCGLGGLLLACSSASPPPAAAPAEEAAGEVAPDATGESGTTDPPVAAPHGKRAPCSTDQSCNEDPAVSALWGVCTEMGVCECSDGFERSPTSDLCRPVPVE